MTHQLRCLNQSRQWTRACLYPFVSLFLLSLNVQAQSEVSLKERISQQPNLSTFYSLLKAVGLDEVLADKKFTLLAPTDEAFSRLPNGTLNLPANKEGIERVRSILRYHIVPQEYSLSDALAKSYLKTLNGQNVRLSIENGQIKAGGASITASNLAASNGMIHTLDSVLFPAERSLLDIIAEREDLKTFNRLVNAAGLEAIVKGTGPYTLFVPTDAAFEKVSSEQLRVWLEEGNAKGARALVKSHTVTGHVHSSEVTRARKLLSLSGQDLDYNVTAEGRFIGETKIIQSDLLANNGTLHLVEDLFVSYEKAPVKVVKKESPALETLKVAIRFGVPTYNDGNHDACAAIYEVAVRGVMNSDDPKLTPESKESLANALDEIATGEKTGRDKSWILRRAMDVVVKSLKAKS